MFENGTAPEEVAKVILKAVTSGNEKADLRYVVGSDANSLLEKRKTMSEREFSKFMSQNILGST